MCENKKQENRKIENFEINQKKTKKDTSNIDRLKKKLEKKK